MRDLIARALVHVLRVLLPAGGSRRATSRHTPPASPPEQHVICGHRPVPAHVLARTVPVPDLPRIPPYLSQWINNQEAEHHRQAERRRAASAARAGDAYDEYTYPGSLFHTLAVPA